VSDDILERAQAWLDHDPDRNTREELRLLLASADPAARVDLVERFVGPLEFGTAGLRGLIGAGESRMNRAVILRTSAGLARYLLDYDAASAKRRGVVVGYDGRRMSREFAEDTACALAAAGVPAHLFPILCSTPVTAFAVNHLGAAAGVMVTASHNPPAYNGYKVYWGNGAQIIPPHDKGIAAAIAAMPPAHEIPRLEMAEAIAQGLCRPIPPEVERAYFDAIRALSVRGGGDRAIPIVYTPLHGVGQRPVRQALAEAGFTRVVSVPEQAEPDGAFPTVAFPNPEEKGALDLAYALADKEGADLVIANDPDVDRLAVAVRDPSGVFVQLTGNQVGVLLGHYLLTEVPGDAPVASSRLVIVSCVSSPMLGAIAKALGVRYEETLTGFKWIANRAMELERQEGLRFVFGYEEALGYSVGPVVRDKDGISAAVVLAELAAVRRAAGMTLLDELEVLARRYGLFMSGQRAIMLPGADGLARISAAMQRLRAAPPGQVGGLAVQAVSDYLARTRTEAGGKESPLSLPATNMLVFELEGGSRIIARPSGTEPKIKFYFDVREPIEFEEPARAAQDRALATIDRLAETFCALAGMT
jgi:phosphomannomutase